MKNIHPLVCRFGTLGDMIMITPLLKRLHERSGVPVDIITSGEWSKTLFDDMPYIRHVYTIRFGKTPYLLNKSHKKLVKLLKEHNYENTWICESDKKLIRLLNKGGITPDKSISSYTYPRLTNEHFVSHWLRLADMSPVDCDYQKLNNKQAEDTELFITDYEIDVCTNWLGTRGINHRAPLICIQTGNKITTRIGDKKRTGNNKYWQEANWAKTIDIIIEKIPDAQILMCGFPSELALTLEIKSLCKKQSNVFSVADDLPLRKLMTLMSISHSCISVDTGPAHVAAAVSCPLTVLTGKTDVRVHSPKSSNSKVVVVAGRDHEIELKDGEEAWKTAHDMSLITVESVINGWKESII